MFFCSLKLCPATKTNKCSLHASPSCFLPWNLCLFRKWSTRIFSSVPRKLPYTEQSKIRLKYLKEQLITFSCVYPSPTVFTPEASLLESALWFWGRVDHCACCLLPWFWHSSMCGKRTNFLSAVSASHGSRAQLPASFVTACNSHGWVSGTYSSRARCSVLGIRCWV